MLSFLFGNNIQKKDPILIELISKWRKFFSLIDIPMIDSDKEMYDFMSKDIRYEPKTHLYFKVHSICPWKDKIQEIDEDGLVIHLCDSLNLYPSDREGDRNILLGYRMSRYGTRMTTIGECLKCNHFSISYIGCHWGCTCKSHHFFGYTPSRYKDLIKAIQDADIQLIDKDKMDSYYTPYIPSLTIQDEKGSYVYIVSMIIDREGIPTTAIHVGTAVSPSAFLWNICDEYPDVKVELLIYRGNTEHLIRDINIIYCAQHGWILGKSLGWIINTIMPR